MIPARSAKSFHSLPLEAPVQSLQCREMPPPLAFPDPCAGYFGSRRPPTSDSGPGPTPRAPALPAPQWRPARGSRPEVRRRTRPRFRPRHSPAPGRPAPGPGEDGPTESRAGSIAGRPRGPGMQAKRDGLGLAAEASRTRG